VDMETAQPEPSGYISIQSGSIKNRSIKRSAERHALDFSPEQRAFIYEHMKDRDRVRPPDATNTLPTRVSKWQVYQQNSYDPVQ